MGWIGNQFKRLYQWREQAQAGQKISSVTMDEDSNDMAEQGISRCLNIDGANSPSTDINFNAKKITNLQPGTDMIQFGNNPRRYCPGDAVSYPQLFYRNDIFDDISDDGTKIQIEYFNNGLNAGMLERGVKIPVRMKTSKIRPVNGEIVLYIKNNSGTDGYVMSVKDSDGYPIDNYDFLPYSVREFVIITIDHSQKNGSVCVLNSNNLYSTTVYKDVGTTGDFIEFSTEVSQGAFMRQPFLVEINNTIKSSNSGKMKITYPNNVTYTYVIVAEANNYIYANDLKKSYVKMFFINIPTTSINTDGRVILLNSHPNTADYIYKQSYTNLGNNSNSIERYYNTGIYEVDFLSGLNPITMDTNIYSVLFSVVTFEINTVRISANLIFHNVSGTHPDYFISRINYTQSVNGVNTNRVELTITPQKPDIAYTINVKITARLATTTRITRGEENINGIPHTSADI